MVLNRLFVVAVLAISFLGVTGCSAVAKFQFSRAVEMERQGRRQEALAALTSLLERIPAENRSMIADVQFRRGELLNALGRPAEAYTAFDLALAVVPEHAGASIGSAELLLSAGSPQRAVERVRPVLEANPNHADALKVMAGAAAAAGNAARAIELYGRVLQRSPERIDVALAAADLQNTLDRVMDARAILLRAAESVPSSPQPWFALGRLEEQEGNTKSAEEAYRRALAIEDSPETNLRLAQFLMRSSRAKEAGEVLVRVDRLRPLLPVAAGDSAMHAGRASQAVDNYLLGLRTPAFSKSRMGNGPMPATRPALAARIVEADIQIAEGNARREGRPVDLSAARLHMTQFAREMDAATRAILEAEIALAARDHEAANAHATEAVELAAASAAAQYVLGEARSRLGDSKGATAAWAEALSNDGNFAPARLSLARAELAAGSPQSAEEYVVPVVREEPGNIEALLLYARVLLSDKRLASAESIARRAAALESGLGEPHVVLAEVAGARGQYAAALAEYQKAIALEPNSEEAIAGLTSLYRRGRITRAMLRQIETVALAKPHSVTLMEIAGRLYAERGWNEDARRCLERVLEWERGRSGAAAALATVLAKSGRNRAAVNSAVEFGGSPAALLEAVRAEQSNDVATAITAYREAARTGDPSGVAANNLAWLLAEHNGDLDEALAMARASMKAAQADPAVLDTLGFVHLKRREYSTAVEVLERAAELARGRGNDPERPELRQRIREHLAEAYLRSGNTSAASDLMALRIAGGQK